MPDDAWRRALERRLGAPVRVLGRAPLTGGYVAASVEQGGPRRRRAGAHRRAQGGRPGRGRGHARGRRGGRAAAAAGDRPGLAGAAVRGRARRSGPPSRCPSRCGAPSPRCTRTGSGERPRGIPVVDAAWWAALCDRTLVAVRGGLARTGEREFADAERRCWPGGPIRRSPTALARLPRTLVHGDAHRGNVLGDTLIDWGDARVAPAALDLATLRAQGAVPPPWFAAASRGRLGRRARPRPVPRLRRRPPRRRPGGRDDRDGRRRPRASAVTAPKSAPPPPVIASRRHRTPVRSRVVCHSRRSRHPGHGTRRTAPVCALVASAA